MTFLLSAGLVQACACAYGPQETLQIEAAVTEFWHPVALNEETKVGEPPNHVRSEKDAKLFHAKFRLRT